MIMYELRQTDARRKDAEDTNVAIKARALQVIDAVYGVSICDVLEVYIADPT